ncbi:hypothetical protein [Limnospira platensis]|nr:hypothetical protein [Arthrospira platensis NCB002]QQW29198.1 hypothetical protein AP9108_31420 [Arthrospira sp. PCC 9108]
MAPNCFTSTINLNSIKQSDRLIAMAAQDLSLLISNIDAPYQISSQPSL